MTTVYRVRRIPGPNERKRYYSISKTRYYGSKAGATSFVKAHKDSTFEITKVEGGWADATEDFPQLTNTVPMGQEGK